MVGVEGDGSVTVERPAAHGAAEKITLSARMLGVHSGCVDMVSHWNMSISICFWSLSDLTKKYLQIASSRVNGDETALEGPFLQICVADNGEYGEDGNGFVKKCCPEGEIIRPDLNKCVRVSREIAQ